MDGLDFSKIPVQAPPEGVISNFENPSSAAPLIAAFVYVTIPPMAFSLILRFYTRIAITRNLGIDDWLSAAAGALMIFYCGLMLSLLNNPIGLHMWDVPLSKLNPKYGFYTVLNTVVYFILAMLIKASILLSYRRLFQISTVANAMIWFGLAANVFFYLISVVVLLSYCVPRSDEWAVGGWYALKFAQRCYRHSSNIAAASGVFGTFIDIFILVVPLQPITTLRASPAKKIGICAIFLAGSSACVFSIVGLVYRIRYYHDPNDDSYVMVPILAMNIGEINLGIISASLPVTFIVFRNLATRFRAWRDSQKPMQPIDKAAAVEVDMYQYQQVEGVPNGSRTSDVEAETKQLNTAAVPQELEGRRSITLGTWPRSDSP
ncbi:hypothetical protein QBC43DRAFT_374006 [Cladorrhinum sp. PSN259]|nr:hypothetical protein QBC43DRAFT_374006 [Cladorrhinum sp. PSN259]